MVLSLRRCLSISAIVLVGTFGVTACSSSGDSNANSSMSKSESISQDKSSEGVAKTLDNFFKTLANETSEVKKKNTSLPSEKTSQDESIVFYKENYPKSIKFLNEGMKDEYTVKILNHLLKTVSKSDDFKVTSIRDAVMVQDASGVLMGTVEDTGFKLFMDGKEQSQSVSKEAVGGRLSLRYSDGSGWKIDSSSKMFPDAQCIEGSNTYSNSKTSSTGCGKKSDHTKKNSFKTDEGYKKRFNTAEPKSNKN